MDETYFNTAKERIEKAQLKQLYEPKEEDEGALERTLNFLHSKISCLLNLKTLWIFTKTFRSLTWTKKKWRSLSFVT